MLIKWIKEQKERKEEMKVGKKEYFTESTRALSNPGCGWYHLYSFDLAKESFLYIACEEEELVLLRINIHAFRSCEKLPKEALDWADRILTFFAQHKKGILLRIVYDTDGHGMEHEPSSVVFVKSHMRQLGAVIKAHAGEILVHQGLFVGSWGEMHDSKFLMEPCMAKLAATFIQATGGTCPIAVRKPVQLRQLETTVLKLLGSSTVSVKLSLFNDGIFGSDTDLGTYGTIRRSALVENSDKEKTPWAREDELIWQKTRLQRSFCGGEALGGMNTVSESIHNTDRFQGPLNWRQAAADLAKMHVSYLNSTYRQELLDGWKAQQAVWNGEEMSGYDYIGRHLGYRFTVTGARIQNGILQITIRNNGFANLCEEAACKVVLVEKKEETFQCFEIVSDPRTWDSGTDTVIECSIPPTFRGTFKAYLQLTRKRDGRILAFANEEYDRQFGVFLSSVDLF